MTVERMSREETIKEPPGRTNRRENSTILMHCDEKRKNVYCIEQCGIFR
jgi:hypothetical protein